MGNINNKANAPYNFVPLNDVVISGGVAPDGDQYFDREKRVTGYINYELETLTPLFIGGGLNNTDQKVTREFFAPGGRVRIPGSSLRGMIRTMVEIMSWGKFGSFDDKHLFYRTFDRSSLSEEYRRVNNLKTNLHAGYLCKKGVDYYIIPAKRDSSRKQFKKMGSNTVENQFTVIKNDDGTWHIISGEFSQKTNEWLVEAPDKGQSGIRLKEEDIKAYQDDSSRYKDKVHNDEKKKKDGDLFRLLRISDEGMAPCFYVKWIDLKGQERVAFGHTPFFRFPYKYSIGEHIPENIKDRVYDISDSIFGDTVHTASRIFFDDAILLNENLNDIYDKEVVFALGSPKPTTFQHYLKQKENASIKTLYHWNHKDAKIRGYKLYWHRHIDLPEKTGNKNIEQIVRPIKQGHIFQGKIRFENLTKVELGALLFALDLPRGLHHKLGMGKPYGFGSVRISPQLFVSDRKERYRRLFESNGWYLAEREEDGEKYKQEFENHILQQIKEGADSLWSTGRMKHLSALLDFNNIKKSNWSEKTRYMLFPGGYKDRPVLPLATEVVGSTEKTGEGLP